MGGSSSRRKKNTPIPPYTPSGSPGINRAGTTFPGGAGNNAFNRDQQLIQANQTIANLNNQLQTLQRSMGMQPTPYGGYPPLGGMSPPMSYGNPMFGQPPYPPPSPLLQHFGGPSGFSNPQQNMMGIGGYRDTDFAAIANIAGLNPADVAFLHREFLNLTRSGTTKMDRTIFRQLLRDILLEANNEHVDRAIESIFQTVDRNRDGFIDFPEFVGAFKDVLKGDLFNSQSFLQDSSYPDILAEQLRLSGVGSSITPQSVALVQQTPILAPVAPTSGLSIVPLAATGIQQVPITFAPTTASIQFSDATPPLVTLDPNQSSYVIATPGQYLITQPTALQCVPLPTT